MITHAHVYICMQKDKVYIMDVAGVNKICNGTFNDSKVFTRVRLITKLDFAGK